jgi:hypothetical protein
VCNGYATLQPFHSTRTTLRIDARLISPMPDGATPVYLAIIIASRAWVDIARKLMHNPPCSSERSHSASFSSRILLTTIVLPFSLLRPCLYVPVDGPSCHRSLNARHQPVKRGQSEGNYAQS